MRDDLLAVLKRDVPRTQRTAAERVGTVLEDGDVPLRAIAGRTKRGDCIAVLTPVRLIVDGGGIDRVYSLLDVSTAVVLRTPGGSTFLPATAGAPADMFIAGEDVYEFAAAVRAQILQLRPDRDEAPIWERVDFTHTIRLDDAALLAAPKGSAVSVGSPVMVTISGAGVQLREQQGTDGMVVAWRDVAAARVEGVDQLQRRPSVGAVLAFGVLGLAASRTERRAYLTIETSNGIFVIEDRMHLPLELRAANGVNRPTAMRSRRGCRVPCANGVENRPLSHNERAAPCSRAELSGRLRLVG